MNWSKSEFWYTLIDKMKTFWERWWFTRKLYLFTYRPRTRGVWTVLVLDRHEELGNAIDIGVDKDSFIDLLSFKRKGLTKKGKFVSIRQYIFALEIFWEKMRTGEQSNDDVERSHSDRFREKMKVIIKDCIKLDYVEMKSGYGFGRDLISVGLRGREIYMWYYPFVAPFGNDYIKSFITKYVFPVLAAWSIVHILNLWDQIKGLFFVGISKLHG